MVKPTGTEFRNITIELSIGQTAVNANVVRFQRRSGLSLIRHHESAIFVTW